MQKLILFKEDFTEDCWVQICHQLDVPLESKRIHFFIQEVDFEV